MELSLIWHLQLGPISLPFKGQIKNHLFLGLSIQITVGNYRIYEKRIIVFKYQLVR